MSVTMLQGDCRDVLRTLPDESVQCVITSPPYFGLRDYGTAQWEGGQPDCTHDAARVKTRFDYDLSDKQASNNGSDVKRYGQSCPCGATRVDAQIGLEQTPAEYVETLVEVFREVRRVLRKDGTVWLNLGDSYYNYRPGKGQALGKQTMAKTNQDLPQVCARRGNVLEGLKEKDLIGIPWRVAFALQADGWWLRSDIIWAKPNCMPESVTDRPTRSHEYIFLLTKAERYYYDADAIREAHTDPNVVNGVYQGNGGVSRKDYEANTQGWNGGGMVHRHREYNPAGRNKRTVWTVATQPLSEAHFATFPERLIEPCVLAGTSPQACEHCGAPWERVVERADRPVVESADHAANGRLKASGATSTTRKVGGQYQKWLDEHPPITSGWQPTCPCEGNTGTGNCIVLDPFAGSGTTLRVAAKHRRSAIGIELNADYISIADKRTNGVQTMMDLPA